MSLSLLEKLPAETRNQIWFECLVSETGYLEPISRTESYFHSFPRSSSPSGPFFYLTTATPQNCSVPANRDTRGHEMQLSNISTSLLRINKRIHAETVPIFWGNNTILFKDPYRMERFERSAGIFAFNKIITLNVGFSSDFEKKVFGMIEKLGKSKANSTSTSISRFELQKLELTISLASLDTIFKNISESQFGTNPTSGLQASKKHDNLLSGLRGGKGLGSEVERKLVVLKRGPAGTVWRPRDEVEMKRVKAVVKELRFAFEH